MKELIERLRGYTTGLATEAADALERLTAERDAAKEKIDTLWIQSADRATKIERLTAELNSIKEKNAPDART